MGLFTRWVELMITQDNQKFVNTCTALDNAGIPYRDKMQYIGHGTRRNGQIGALGENPKHANLYQIFVKKGDAERAKWVIAQG